MEALPVWPVSRAEAVMGSSSRRVRGGLTFLTLFKTHRRKPYNNLTEIQHLTPTDITLLLDVISTPAASKKHICPWTCFNYLQYIHAILYVYTVKEPCTIWATAVEINWVWRIASSRFFEDLLGFRLLQDFEKLFGSCKLAKLVLKELFTTHCFLNHVIFRKRQ